MGVKTARRHSKENLVQGSIRFFQFSLPIFFTAHWQHDNVGVFQGFLWSFNQIDEQEPHMSWLLHLRQDLVVSWSFHNQGSGIQNRFLNELRTAVFFSELRQKQVAQQLCQQQNTQEGRGSGKGIF